MPKWYWKNGRLALDDDNISAVGSEPWFEKMVQINEKLGDKDYKTVGKDDLWWGGHVSTVWLGLDHSMPFLIGDEDEPLIFETMVFLPKFPRRRFRGNCYQERYSTLKQAKDGHSRAVKRFRNPLNIWRV